MCRGCNDMAKITTEREFVPQSLYENKKYRKFCLIRTDVDPKFRQNPDYACRNYMYRKGLGTSNQSGVDENPEYICPD